MAVYAATMAVYAATCPRLAIPSEEDRRVTFVRRVRPLFEWMVRRWLEAGDMTEELYRCKEEYGYALASPTRRRAIFVAASL
jgi:hypothetical protein